MAHSSPLSGQATVPYTQPSPSHPKWHSPRAEVRGPGPRAQQLQAAHTSCGKAQGTMRSGSLAGGSPSLPLYRLGSSKCQRPPQLAACWPCLPSFPHRTPPFTFEWPLCARACVGVRCCGEQTDTLRICGGQHCGALQGPCPEWELPRTWEGQVDHKRDWHVPGACRTGEQKPRLLTC